LRNERDAGLLLSAEEDADPALLGTGPAKFDTMREMSEEAGLAGIVFTEGGRVDIAQLNGLYKLIGWDRSNRRTVEDTIEMLKVSRYHVVAVAPGAGLVGFARVCGDPYVAQVLDVVTHPEYRRRGIATRCMRGVVEHLRRSKYVCVTLTDGSGFAGFYERFEFRVFKDIARIWTPTTAQPADHLA
jgi:ribosomal protein S18 acetylase RimI-like enzyme